MKETFSISSKQRKNTKSRKNTRLKIRLKAWRNGKIIIATTRSSKTRLQHIIRNLKAADKYYLKVTYGRGQTINGVEEIYNHGDYFTKVDLLRAFSIFTSKIEILDYIDNFSLEKRER